MNLLDCCSGVWMFTFESQKSLWNKHNIFCSKRIFFVFMKLAWMKAIFISSRIILIVMNNGQVVMSRNFFGGTKVNNLSVFTFPVLTTSPTLEHKSQDLKLLMIPFLIGLTLRWLKCFQEHRRPSCGHFWPQRLLLI